ncbi:ankyrin repeat domain-containing protein 26 isoform X2 [Lingula anatina]|uniref:Ankyrin repeat domain-containing protein 26 isoform X2 n=1 Tax=Lingula anatina TaxID=7574 RepID=A0A2R2MNC4_LINAN|nr:ankyrin repeat domain-containing protein 26 isoform X2 [Lingula anatina]|eukprot:XP_023931710.1 ankyrin repeat domain-containing protein 26 isoform X2 [Lingula anatina]
MEAELSRRKEEERKQWEKQERERAERLKKEQERLEAERLQREEEERLEEERQEREQQELLERVRRELEDREEQERLEREQQLRAETPKLSSDITDSDQDRSQRLKERREKAERELEEARRKQHSVTGVTSRGATISDDDNSSLDDSELLASPRGNGKVNGFVSATRPVGVNSTKPFSMNEDEDDGLSYSSTDNSEVMNGTYSMSPYLKESLLNTSNLNDSNLTRLQEQLREQSRRLDKEHGIRMRLENKKKAWEKEKAELNKRISELSQAKSSLEQIKLELEARLRTNEYGLNEEVEKRKNAEVLFNKIKEQLARKDSQYTKEIEAKQKVELSMRNLQMENRIASSNIKQLEEERDELQRQLKQEKNARAMAEQLSEEQSRLQQAMQEETSKSTTQKYIEAEVVSKFETADEGRRQALENIEKLKTELYRVTLELDMLKKKYRDEQTLLTTENEELQQKVDEAKNEVKLNEEALTHASMQYNVQIGHCKAEMSLLSSNLEKEKSSREKLETELESMKSLLTAANLELEKTRLARNELEKSYQKDKEDWDKTIEKKEAEVQSFKESNQSLSQRYGAAEAKYTAIESELRAANTSLLERSNQIASLQRDLDQKKTAYEHLDQQIRKEKELNAKVQAKLEAAQERVTGLQHEMQTLRQQFDDARSKDSIKERAALDTQDKFSFMLSSLRNDHDKSRGALEEKNSSLNETVSRLREEVRASDSRRILLEQEMRHLQQEMTETSKKLTTTEANLEVTVKIKEHAEAEKTRLGLEIEKLRHRLESSQEKEAESKAKISELTDRLEQVEQSSMLTTQQLANTSANAEAVNRTKLISHTGHRYQDDLEDAVHRLELEKARLEASLTTETQKVETLQREMEDSNRVRHSMEALLSNLKTTNAQLEEKVTQEAASRSILAREAEDSRDMWESEVKSRSKLGLRLAQLERAKQEAQAVVDEEKRKARKAVEMKKVAETKLDSESERRLNLEKEVANLKTHLKTAKKRLKDLEGSESRISSLHSEFDRERLAMEGTMQTLRRQLDELQSQLNEEIEQKDRYEAKTRQLQQELNALKTLEKSFAKLERTKHKMETDFNSYKNHVNQHYVDRGELQRAQQDNEMKLRQELNTKLEEVNSYLEDQARARERLDTMRNNNESQIRNEYEKTKKELMDELSKLRAGYHQTMAQKETKDLELQKYKELYENEVRLRERVATRLQKATDTAANTKAQLSLERQKTLLLGASPPLARKDNQWVSPLGGVKTTPVHGVNDSLSYKIKNQLDKSIAKHLESAGASSSPVLPPDDSMINSSFGKSTSDYMATLRRNYFV